MKKSKFLFLLLIFITQISTFAQTKIPEPKDVLGFTPGDDRKLASWNQVLEYFQKLEDTSPRVRFEAIGKTTMDKPFVFATISAPENLKRLEYYKGIQAKLADPRLIKSNDAVARQLIKEGKTIVLITCGIHSTEVGSTLSSMLIAHKLATSNEPEVQNVLKNTIVLLVPSLNPDGVDIVKNWYDKTLGTPYEGTSPPELYHKYVGHDNNRDWYAFTQIETQLTVDKIHNVWHPQIVNDIHQQGPNGARQFVPPYLPPVEPNVPAQIVEGYTELGNYMLQEMLRNGYVGMTNNSTYDAWTPARAYSHYHGGVRILTETASVRLATPVTVKFEDLRVPADDGYDPKKETPNFPKLWQGGEWRLRDITNYMTASTFFLLKHAADNRERWLTRFYQIGKEAVRPRKDGELFAYVLPTPQSEEQNIRRRHILAILKRSEVKFGFVNPEDIKNTKFQNYLKSMISSLTQKNNGLEKPAIVIPANQPYGIFAKAMLENQEYPNLRDANGNPIQPYDVTAHTLPLLYGVEAIPIYQSFNINYIIPKNTITLSKSNPIPEKFAVYRSHNPSMDEGWTRWIFENRNFWQVKPNAGIIQNQEIHGENLNSKYKTIIFPDQSANQILNGYAKGSMPEEYTGGVGKEGVENLRKFVEAGGTLVFLNRASNFAIEQFKLPVRDVTQGAKRADFYIPGSILRTELDTTHPVAKGMDKLSIAWFENSPAFEIKTDPLALANNFRIIARYPSDPKEILLSGWALGAERIAGKAALVEFTIGKGKIYLFGFRPQYRGQSLATFPLFFNAITER
ncbi:MAG: M14 family metallopeptidase [Acidobacteriota bacterium]|nr:M14 family metallopeptidase [Acidobacteriota bacterium]